MFLKEKKKKMQKSHLRYSLHIVCVLCLSLFTGFFFFQNHSDMTNDTNGTILQTSLYYESNKSCDLPSMGQDIVIDSQNNMYILTKIHNSSNATDYYMLIKYDNGGLLQWNQTLPFTTLGINSLGLDSSDNIYLAGTVSNGSAYDIMIGKYNPSGQLIKNMTWDGGGSEYGVAVSIDDDNNIYVLGNSYSYDILGDIVILKYNSSGNFQWNSTWGDNDTDNGGDIENDMEGNAYFTGYRFLGGNCYIIVVKLNQSGDLQWERTWGRSYLRAGYALTIDTSNNIFITGFDEGEGAMDANMFVSKLNSSGDLIWNYTHDDGVRHHGYDIALDSKGNIYVVGEAFWDMLLVKLDPAGNKIWAKTEESELIGERFGLYGVALDDYENVYCIGGYLGESEEYGNYLLLKYLPSPDNFKVISYADHPDHDGNFTFTWTESFDADNYSIYQSYFPIKELNSSAIEVVSGNTNRIYHFENYIEGVYYFLVIAINEYGNTSSNCIQVTVQFPPAEFELYNLTGTPHIDGIINLTWSPSVGADYYYVFMNGSMVDYNIVDEFYTIEGLTNGEYYFEIGAENEAGFTVSNNISTEVHRAPTSFTLTSEADIPVDTDGTFELVWTHSEFALNYTLFMSDSPISIINDSIQELYNFTPQFEWPTYRYNLCHCLGTGLTNGTYYFKVIASNQYGYSTTECLEVEVGIPIEPQERGSNIFDLILPQLITYVTLGSLITGSIILYKKRR
jgi:hypothetical protein